MKCRACQTTSSKLILGISGQFVCVDCIEMYSGFFKQRGFDISQLKSSAEVGSFVKGLTSESKTILNMEIDNVVKIHLDSKSVSSPESILSFAHGLKSHLSENIFGQNELIDTLTHAFTQYYVSLSNEEVEKSNVLIIGGSGTGKTETVNQVLAYMKTHKQFKNFSVIEVDVTSLTPTGIVGNSIGELVFETVPLEDLESGAIIYLDEFDKFFTSDHRQDALYELYKMMEGSQYEYIKKNIGGGKEKITVDTSKVIFVCSGAFQSLSETKNRSTLGLNHKSGTSSHAKKVDQKDLSRAGIPKEIRRRFGFFTSTNELSEKTLMDILKHSKRSPYLIAQKFLASLRIDFKLSDKKLREIARDAASSPLGIGQLKMSINPIVDELFKKGVNREKIKSKETKTQKGNFNESQEVNR